MKSRIHHAALNVAKFDWYVDFFQSVFGMTVEKTTGEKPMRKVWFLEGIQLNERENPSVCGDSIDHVSLAVEDVPGVVETAVNAGCSVLPDGAHWFKLPNGTRIELKPLQ